MWSKLLTLIAPLLLCTPILASDHADPLFDSRPDAGLTGLFVFPDGDRMVFIVNIHPGLKAAPPYDLEPYHYRLHIDTHSQLVYNDPQDLLRYGGTLLSPSGIGEDMTIELALNNDASLLSKNFSGFSDTSGIRLWTGVRDDPFIFPKFFGTNVISMVASIPLSDFPKGQEHWVVWATTHKGGSGKQIDHVGRSIRTMNPRLNFLNTLHPREHVAAISKRRNDPNLFQDFLMKQVAPLFALRPYDVFPDVLIYSNQRPLGYPNGRRLEDDVAAIACRGGDCLLWEMSFADSAEWPRKTTNDKPFLREFPYLAEPWPNP